MRLYKFDSQQLVQLSGFCVLSRSLTHGDVKKRHNIKRSVFKVSKFFLLKYCNFHLY